MIDNQAWEIRYTAEDLTALTCIQAEFERPARLEKAYCSAAFHLFNASPAHPKALHARSSITGHDLSTGNANAAGRPCCMA